LSCVLLFIVRGVADGRLVCAAAAQNNRLGDVGCLAGLTRLLKLDLGRNRVGSLAGLTALTALKLLSVEDNELDSLAGVEVMGALMELYCGNNRWGHCCCTAPLAPA
jgi:hypothetical protein